MIDSDGDGVGHDITLPQDLAVDDVGNAYVADGPIVFRSAPDGHVSILIDFDGDGAGNTLRNANGLAIDAAGNVYVAGSGSDNVFKVTPGGAISEIADRGTGGPGFRQPKDLVVDDDGNVFVATLTGVFRVAPDGKITEPIDNFGDGLGNVLRSLSRLALDDAGNLYVSGSTSNNVIRVPAAP